MGVTIDEHPTAKTNRRHFTVTIDGTTTVSTTLTSHPGVARDWIHHTLHHRRRNRHRLVVGLGVQWTPNNPPPATLQLCMGRRCLIFHLHHSDTVPRILRRLLSDPRTTLVGLWCSPDAKKLAESKHQISLPRGMPVDLRVHVSDTYYCSDEEGMGSLRGKRIGMIAKRVLGMDVEWDLQAGCTDWEQEELDDDQVVHACVKAYVAFSIGVKIEAWKLNNNL